MAKLSLQRTPEEGTPGTDPSPYPGTPRWVKVFAIIALVVVLLAVIMLVTGAGGDHGPWRHMRSGNTPPPSVTVDYTPLIEPSVQQL